MCGLAGFLEFSPSNYSKDDVLESMSQKIEHRGRDGKKKFIGEKFNVIFNRLAIVDLKNGMQPFVSQDENVILVCNGEIYNYKELRERFSADVFKSNTDTEVLLYLYLQEGKKFVDFLDGQFAIAIYDKRTDELILVRDHFGICPLFYAKTANAIVFASEIKALLEYPEVEREVNYRGLDQVFTFPGIVSPVTMFKGISSVSPASIVVFKEGVCECVDYWSLEYPEQDFTYISDLSIVKDMTYDLLQKSVKKRLQSDVDLGVYVSGGLDSSILASLVKKEECDFKLFSIGFDSKNHDESLYQNILAEDLKIPLFSKQITEDLILENLKETIYQCETVLKESYNACSLLLSKLAASHNTRVILAGEGADEFFGGYIGSRFDQMGSKRNFYSQLNEHFEKEIRRTLWQDEECIYEKNYYDHTELREQLYSEKLSGYFHKFSATAFPLFNKVNLQGRHPLHKRAWLDYRLRLSDHLVSDHGDRMGMANTVEVRYPFLDKELVEFSTKISPDILVKNNIEKYVLKSLELVPEKIRQREKYGFHAQGTPQLLQEGCAWVQDYLSYDYIAKRGVFNPDSVDYLKEQYSSPGFKINIPYEDDILMCILTFNLLTEIYDMKC